MQEKSDVELLREYADQANEASFRGLGRPNLRLTFLKSPDLPSNLSPFLDPIGQM